MNGNDPCAPLASPSHRHSERSPIAYLDALAAITRCDCNQEIYSDTQSAKYLYCVTYGAARECAFQRDGRRRILGLLLPGDFFGFTPHDMYDFTVEAAVNDTIIACYPRRRLEILAESDARLAHQMRQVTLEAICRLQAQLLVIGRPTAVEKVHAFLRHIAGRLANDRSDHVVLPISRYDIADYVAISVETVSRSLTELERRGVISFAGTRRITFLDRSAADRLD